MKPVERSPGTPSKSHRHIIDQFLLLLINSRRFRIPDIPVLRSIHAASQFTTALPCPQAYSCSIFLDRFNLLWPAQRESQKTPEAGSMPRTGEGSLIYLSESFFETTRNFKAPSS